MTSVLCKEDVIFFRRRIWKWFAQNGRELPWRHTKDPYLVLLAEFLLQQTNVDKALQAYAQLSVRYPSVVDLARTKPQLLRCVFRAIGLAYRAERLTHCARIIVREWNGEIPPNPEALMSLPGVGKYIARSVCTTAFGMRLAVVDTNIARVLERFFGLVRNRKRARDDPKVWRAAQELMSKREPAPAKWNWAVLDFAALVCRTHHPLCRGCTVSGRCVHLKQFS